MSGGDGTISTPLAITLLSQRFPLEFIHGRMEDIPTHLFRIYETVSRSFVALVSRPEPILADFVAAKNHQGNGPRSIDILRAIKGQLATRAIWTGGGGEQSPPVRRPSPERSSLRWGDATV